MWCIRNNTRGNFNKHEGVARGFIKINECIFVYTRGTHCIIGLYNVNHGDEKRDAKALSKTED